MFKSLDATHEEKINFLEFKISILKIAKWGYKITDAESEFKKIDSNNNGQIFFDEFADYCI